MKNDKYIEARRILLRFVSEQAKAKGITHEQIASKTGFDRSNVGRMLAGRFSPTLDNFLRLAEAVEVYFFLSDKESEEDLVKLMRDRHLRESDHN